LTLRLRALSAVRWTTLAAFSRAALQLAQLTILARLLAPEDYGLMAMVVVVLGFGMIFADLGVNSAYVQRQDVTPAERSSLFWLNVGVSVGLTILVITLSRPIAWFFGDERLVPLLVLAATTFVIGALGQQLRMDAEKALEFSLVVPLEIGAGVLGFISAVAAALAGWGVYSLILGAIVTAASATALAWVFLARGWRPMWRFRVADVRSYLGFGGAVVGTNIVNQVNKDIDLLLGGRMLAASVLGLYSLPRQIVFQVHGMVNPIVIRVGFPLIAQVQRDVSRVGVIYLKTLNMTSSINAPLYAGLAFFAPEIVRIVFGEKWIASADLLRLLAIWGFIRSTANPVGSLLLGMGRASLQLKWNLALLFIVPPVLWGGSRFGVTGLAWALLGLSAALFVPGWMILVRSVCRVGLLDYSVAALRPFLIAVASIIPAYVLTAGIESDHIRLVAAMAFSVPAYLGVSYWTNRDWFDSMLALVAPRWSAWSKR
jgi:O-antigen/teichoic acid export membrane protein